jgi:hypothetical protein
MSEGATMSTPASACASAWRSRMRRVSSVGHDAEVGETLFQRCNCARDQPLRIEGFTPIGGFQARVDGRE